MSRKKGQNNCNNNYLKNFRLDKIIIMSNITGEEGSFASGNSGEEVQQETQQKQIQNHQFHGSNLSGILPSGTSDGNNSSSHPPPLQQQPPKKKRNLPGTPGKFDHTPHQSFNYI